jgi:hypothetical protein
MQTQGLILQLDKKYALNLLYISADQEISKKYR